MVNLEGICEKAISRIDNNEEIYVKEKKYHIAITMNLFVK